MQRLVARALLASGALVTTTAIALSSTALGQERESTHPVDGAAVVELVAPVGGSSLRASRELRERISRRHVEAIDDCLERLGYDDLPPFQFDDTRFLMMPDPVELRARGFHMTIDPPAPGALDDEYHRPGPHFDQDALRCDEQVRRQRSHIESERLLNVSWMEEVATPIERRAEEARLWEQAATCLARRGYDRSQLGDEVSFLGLLRGELRETDVLEEQQGRELRFANDYVDCAEPQWTARTAAKLAVRDAWVAEHEAELRGLTEALRHL